MAKQKITASAPPSAPPLAQQPAKKIIEMVLVRIDPASKKLSYAKLGGGVFQSDNVYKMSRPRAEELKDVYVKTGDPSSGRLFLIHTIAEARAWEALQKAKIREPRGTTEDPIEFDENARAVA